MATRAQIAAVSGIDTEQAFLDQTGANIANANTVGYKQGEVMFADLLAEQLAGAAAPTASSGGVNPVALGSGVRVASVAGDLAEGTLQTTGVPTDVAITGSGYFVVSQGGQQLYTRDGALTVDASGELTTLTGGKVLGWQASSTGTITNNTQPVPITIPTGQTIPATSTSLVDVSGNLPAWGGGTTTPPSVTVTTDAYNALGDVVPVVLTFKGTPTADVWSMTGVAKTPVTGSTVTLFTTANPPTVVFSPTTGQIQQVAGQAATATGITVTVAALPTGISNLAIHFAPPSSSGALTQYAGQETVSLSQNGYAAGSLVSYSIGSSGIVSGTFSNGQTQSLAQIALASFANPSGLAQTSNNMFMASANSGLPAMGAPGTGVRGTLLGGELEQSNVTIATQLTNLMTAEQAYVANTKVIATSQQTENALMQA